MRTHARTHMHAHTHARTRTHTHTCARTRTHTHLLQARSSLGGKASALEVEARFAQKADASHVEAKLQLKVGGEGTQPACVLWGALAATTPPARAATECVRQGAQRRLAAAAGAVAAAAVLAVDGCGIVTVPHDNAGVVTKAPNFMWWLLSDSCVGTCCTPPALSCTRAWHGPGGPWGAARAGVEPQAPAAGCAGGAAAAQGRGCAAGRGEGKRYVCVCYVCV